MRLHSNKTPPRRLVDSVAKSQYNCDVWIAPEKWDLSIRRNVLCEVCRLPISFVPTIDALCSVCNVVAHITCLNEKERKQMYRNCWICMDCADDLAYSKSSFLSKKKDVNFKKVSNASQITIAKIWRGYYQKQKYRRIYARIVSLQRVVHTIFRRNMLSKFRQSLARPVYVTVNRCLNLPKCDWDTGKADPYVLISVVEKHEHTSQLWSFCTRVINTELNPVFDEVFVIPGISGDQLIVFTVIDQDDSRDQCVGQAIVNMSQAQTWRKGGKFIYPLVPVAYTPTDIGKSVRIDYSTIKPAGTIEVEIHSNRGISDFCGFVYGPSVEDLKRAVRHHFDDALMEVREPGALETDRIPGLTAHSTITITMKKIWIVILHGKLYLHRTFGSPCKIMIDFAETTLGFFVKHKKLHIELVLSLNSIVPLVFTSVEAYDADILKTSFLHAWRYSRNDSSFNVASLVKDLVRVQKTLNEKANKSKVDKNSESSKTGTNENGTSNKMNSVIENASDDSDEESERIHIEDLPNSTNKKSNIPQTNSSIGRDETTPVAVHGGRANIGRAGGGKRRQSIVTLSHDNDRRRNASDTSNSTQSGGVDLKFKQQFMELEKNNLDERNKELTVHRRFEIKMKKSIPHKTSLVLKKGHTAIDEIGEEKKIIVAEGAAQYGIYLIQDSDNPIEALKARRQAQS